MGFFIHPPYECVQLKFRSAVDGLRRPTVRSTNYIGLPVDC